MRHLAFLVRNGPGITVSGLQAHGLVNFMVWVLTLVVVAWSAWYFATQWSVPPVFAKTSTYATPMKTFG